MTTYAIHSPVVRWAGLAAFAAAVTAAALIGTLAVTGTATEYATLETPAWAPPSWLFGPVWTVLYGMIAVAGWLVWRKVGADKRLVPYAIQLVLNAAWTPTFFGAGWYGLALIDIVAMWVAIVVTIVVFRRVHQVAAWLLVPYLLWVSFATALNAAIYLMNR